MHGFGLDGRGGHTALMSYSDERASKLKCTHTSYLSSCLIVMSSDYPVAQQCPWDLTKLEGAVWGVAPAETTTTTTTMPTTTCPDVSPEAVQEEA